MTVPSVASPAILKATPACLEFELPTANQMIFSQTDPDRFFQPTTSGRIISASYGFVRNPGERGGYTKFHEGIDIRPLEHDSEGEPTDEVRSPGPGKVAYLNHDPDDSNYGRYVILEHDHLGSTFHTLYAHLASIDESLIPGRLISKGERLGVMGRTSNEFDIDRDHAHLHFEVDLMVNDRYVEWSQKRGKGIPKHGLYNGANLLGVDPVRFYQFLQYNPDLGINDFMSREPIAFRILVPYRSPFSWIRHHPGVLWCSLSPETFALEISMSYYGLPVRIKPLVCKELTTSQRKAIDRGVFPLTYANSKELQENKSPLLTRSNGKYWNLSSKGREWVHQLTF